MAVIDLDQASFQEVVAKNAIVLIDFWAPWCGPCRSFAPIFEQASEKNPDITFAKVNTDEQRELAMQFQVRSIPTLVVIRDQIVLAAQPGALPESALDELISRVKALDMDEVRRDIAAQEQAARDEG